MQGYVSYIIDEFHHNYCGNGTKILTEDSSSREDKNAHLYCMFYSMLKNINIYNLHGHVYHNMNRVDIECAISMLGYKIDMSKINDTVERIYNVLTDPKKLRLIGVCPEYYEKKYIVDMIAKIMCVRNFIVEGYSMRDYLPIATKEATELYKKCVKKIED